MHFLPSYSVIFFEKHYFWCQQTIYKTLLRKIINTFGSNVFIAALNLLIAIVVSQYLGAGGKGEQSIIITSIALILVVCNIAGGSTLVYLVPRFNNFKIIASAYLWSLLIVAFIYLLLSSFQWAAPHYIFHISLLTLLSSFTAINAMILLGHERVEAKNFIAVTQVLFVVAALLFFFLYAGKKSISSYITALYIGYIVSFLVSALYVLPYIFKSTKQEGGSYKILLPLMFRYGFLNQLGHIMQLLSIRLSYYLLLLLLGEESVGIYSNAVSLAESVWLVSKSIATVQYARIANSKDVKYAREITIKLFKAAFALSFLIILPLVLLPASFYTTVFGPEFGSVNKILAVLAPGVLIYNFAIIIGHYFSGQGQYHVNTLSAAIGLITVIALCYFLIPIMGVYGAALATVVSFLFMSLFLLVYFYGKTRFPLSELLPGKSDFSEIKALLTKKSIS